MGKIPVHEIWFRQVEMLLHQSKQQSDDPSLEQCAESVTLSGLPHFLDRLAAETIPEGTQGTALLERVAARLDLSVPEIKLRLAARERQLGLSGPPDPLEALRASIIGESDFRSMAIPAQPVIMSPWLKTGMLVLVSAARGVGKSWFALSLLVAVTRGLPIGRWRTETPVPCLYLDGEMSEQDLQKRLRMLAVGLPAPVASLDLLSAAMMHRSGCPSPNCSAPDWREAIYNFLREAPYRLVVLDNIASLTPGLDENDKSAWDPVNQWLLRLRFLGITVILVHHLGKATGNKASQRGTSSREDAIDVSITLKHPRNYRATDGCRCDVEFTKTRGVHGDGVSSFCFALKDAGDGIVWSTDSIKTASKDTVIALLGSGVRQKEIPAMLGIDKGAVSRIKTMAVKDEIIKEGKRGQCSFTAQGTQDFGHFDLDSILR